jgi:TolA-binding protein
MVNPDAVWLVGSLAVAGIAAGPAYIAAKRGAKRAESTDHAEAEHKATRDAMVEALSSVVGPLNGRLDEMHAQLNDIREWQTDHAVEHATEKLTRPSVLEYRKRG